MMTNIVEQNKKTESSLVQLNSQGEIQWISLNPNPIQRNATQLYELLRQKDTIQTYKQAIIKTVILLKYLLALVFYVFLLGIALLISIWGIGYSLGGQFQKWLDNGGQGRQPEELVMELLKILYSPIQKLLAWANQYIETHLPGWKPSNCKFFETSEKKEEIK